MFFVLIETFMLMSKFYDKDNPHANVSYARKGENYGDMS